jgi:hypothetical protein
MPLLDLLGIFAGAAFLAASVTLAVLIDRREARGADPAPEPEPFRPSPLAPGGRRLRLVLDTDR